jgi:hypothetical protein
MVDYYGGLLWWITRVYCRGYLEEVRWVDEVEYSRWGWVEKVRLVDEVRWVEKIKSED